MPTDTANLAWLAGFRARMEGKPKPSGADRAAGWLAADRLLKSGGGGYG